MTYERPYYSDRGGHPLLFYVVFGVRDEELTISQSRHHVDQIPEGLDAAVYDRGQHGEYMEALTGGALGEQLRRENAPLYEKAVAAPRWAVLRGEIAQDDTLDYLRNAIGLVQAFVETGAVAVLDLLTFTLWEAGDWTERIFETEFDPRDHVSILLSEMEDGTAWLHTRGMRKFGRPDIGVEQVPAEGIDDAAAVIGQMIWYGSLGVFFEQGKAVKLHTHSGKAFVVAPEFVDDFENDEYNNAYYRLAWGDCRQVE